MNAHLLLVGIKSINEMLFCFWKEKKKKMLIGVPETLVKETNVVDIILELVLSTL